MGSILQLKIRQFCMAMKWKIKSLKRIKKANINLYWFTHAFNVKRRQCFNDNCTFGHDENQEINRSSLTHCSGTLDSIAMETNEMHIYKYIYGHCSFPVYLWIILLLVFIFIFHFYFFSRVLSIQFWIWIYRMLNAWEIIIIFEWDTLL